MKAELGLTESGLWIGRCDCGARMAPELAYTVARRWRRDHLAWHRARVRRAAPVNRRRLRTLRGVL